MSPQTKEKPTEVPLEKPSRKPDPIRVFLCCTGVGIMNRGIESFARECFDGLKETPGLDLRLFKGRGPETEKETRVFCLPRTWPVIEWMGKAAGRNGYVVEQLSSFFPLIPHIRRHRPHVIFTSDSNLMFQLYRWRERIGVPYRLLFSNGGPCHPPFIRREHVQQVAPPYLEEALAMGEPENKHSLVPYGITVTDDEFVHEPERKRELRKKLELPAEGKLVISVGWISRKLKRMDYTVEEIARLPEPRPHLLMLGQQDETSGPILKLAREMLGETGFTARTVSYEEVPEYYKAADLFVLGSLQEGFGRVFLEALMHGLPVVANDHSVMRFVLGEEGIFGDFSKAGGMARLVEEELKMPVTLADMERRRKSVRDRFSWEALAPKYLEMFHAAYRTEL